jgi:asparagine synthase (glutamine-hydrolysing)
MDSQGNRIVLSGIGGDEFLGGVPSPVPELSDLLARLKFRTFGHQLRSWALTNRKPWLKLLLQSAQPFLPPFIVRIRRQPCSVPWLAPDFAKRHAPVLGRQNPRVRPFGPLPSFQDNIETLQQIRRLIASTTLLVEPLHEKRYPYLDRDLLEFLYAIPREQLLRPGQRRSLMRRSLIGVVPDEILNRRRKACVTRMPLATVSAQWSSLYGMSRDMVCVSLGIVDPRLFTSALEQARDGLSIPMIALMRVFTIECWLRHIRDRGVLARLEQSPGSRTDQGALATSAAQSFS